MKHGIYYAFWENEWNGDFLYYIEKVAKLGFDVLEIAAHHINSYNAQQLAAIRQCAKDNGIILTAGIGPTKEKNLSSSDAVVRKAGQKAFRMIQEMMMEAEVGKTYPNAKVKSITSFGAFVEFLPGKEGLVHISELENRRVDKVEDVVALGDQISVKCIGIDGQGKVRLSRKATLAAPQA